MWPQIKYCSVVIIIMELTHNFINSLSSQVIITLEILDKPIQSEKFMRYMKTVNKLSWKETFRNWLVIKAFKQKLLTIYQFNKVLFILRKVDVLNACSIIVLRVRLYPHNLCIV